MGQTANYLNWWSPDFSHQYFTGEPLVVGVMNPSTCEANLLTSSFTSTCVPSTEPPLRAPVFVCEPGGGGVLVLVLCVFLVSQFFLGGPRFLGFGNRRPPIFFLGFVHPRNIRSSQDPSLDLPETQTEAWKPMDFFDFFDFWQLRVSTTWKIMDKLPVESSLFVLF